MVPNSGFYKEIKGVPYSGHPRNVKLGYWGSGPRDPTTSTRLLGVASLAESESRLGKPQGLCRNLDGSTKIQGLLAATWSDPEGTSSGLVVPPYSNSP